MADNIWDQLKAYFPANLDTSLSLAGVIFLPIITVAQPQPTIPNPGQWSLVWHDEFNGTSLDTTKWSPSYGNGGNGELQQYTPTAISVADGKLSITARKEELAGRPYTSGVITTMNKHAWTYGLFEFRMKVPAGRGLWSAAWALTEDYRLRPAEIDVMEILGDEQRVSILNMVVHWAGGGKSNRKYDIAPDKWSNAFHTYAVQWEPGLLIWYVDGIERHRSTEGVPTQPCFIIANLAVGGDWPGAPDSSTPFPSVLEIEYIRVFQKLSG